MGKSDSWWFEHQEPARYRVAVERYRVVVWAKSPGDAVDVALEYIDATDRVNAIGSPLQIERLAGPPEDDDVRATDEGWTPPQTDDEALMEYEAFERRERRIDNAIKLGLFGTPLAVGVVLGLLLAWLL
jgi:hypothetical protein